MGSGRFVEEVYVEDELTVEHELSVDVPLFGLAVLVILAIGAGVAIAMLVGRGSPT